MVVGSASPFPWHEQDATLLPCQAGENGNSSPVFAVVIGTEVLVRSLCPCSTLTEQVVRFSAMGGVTLHPGVAWQKLGPHGS